MRSASIMVEASTRLQRHAHAGALHAGSTAWAQPAAKDVSGRLFGGWKASTMCLLHVGHL
jgi:hypothetical protein